MSVRRPLTILLLAVAAFPASASTATSPGAGARYVRAAIPAIAVYGEDQGGSFVGMTVAKLRAYDRSIKNVAIRRATKTRYCVESTVGGKYHYDGPFGRTVRTGPCGRSGSAVPAPKPRVQESAEQLLEMGRFAAGIYHYEHKTFVGMTVAKLQRLDGGVNNISIVRATKTSYCIQTTVSGTTSHLDGPDGPLAAGACS